MEESKIQLLELVSFSFIVVTAMFERKEDKMQLE
jgi:hypothetical protein